MTIETKIIALAQAIAADVKSLRAGQGDLTALSTTSKGSLVVAINELYTLIGSAGASIDDNAVAGATNVAWSADKIITTIALAKSAVKDEIIGGASAAYDTFVELQALMQADDTLTAALSTAVTNRVRFDESQTLTVAQQLIACTNIGVGDPTHDYVADYATAKA